MSAKMLKPVALVKCEVFISPRAEIPVFKFKQYEYCPRGTTRNEKIYSLLNRGGFLSLVCGKFFYFCRNGEVYKKGVDITDDF